MGLPALRVVDDAWLAWRRADHQAESALLTLRRHPMDCSVLWQDMEDERVFAGVGALFFTMARAGVIAMAQPQQPARKRVTRGRQCRNLPTAYHKRRVILALERDETPRTVRELAELLNLSPQRIGVVVSEMVTDGQLNRERDENDRRRMVLSLIPGHGAQIIPIHPDPAVAALMVEEAEAVQEVDAGVAIAPAPDWANKIRILAEWEGKSEAAFVDELLEAYRSQR